MCLPWLKTSEFLRNVLKTPGHGVKAFRSREPVRLMCRHSPLLRGWAATGYYWLLGEDSVYLRPHLCAFDRSSLSLQSAISSPLHNQEPATILQGSEWMVPLPLRPSLIFCHHPSRISFFWLGSKNISYISLIMSYYIVDNLFLFLSFLLNQNALQVGTPFSCSYP